MEYIVLSEISKKQDYIFKSNKLKENIGASLIIKYITEELSKQYLDQFHGESIFEGGGKSLYKFYEKDKAKSFIKKMSKDVLVNYPGVEIFMVHQEYNPDEEDVMVKINQVYEELAIKKSERKHSVRQISYGLHKVCRSTQKPASNYSTLDKMPISQEIETKLKFSNEYKNTFENLLPAGYKFPSQFDELADDKKSFIAVVHIDGNQMGKKINQFNNYNQYKGSGSLKEHNENYLKKLQTLSSDITTQYEQAFKEMCNELVQKKELLVDNLDLKEILPIRPLILAGDDVTFVTNAKIGVELSRIFLEKLNNKVLKLNENDQVPLHACAGVSIVKAHYPFSKAYQLAEELCENGKKQIIKDNKGEDYSLLDWHVAYGELSGNLSHIRDSYYRVIDSNDGIYNHLTMKPLYLNNKDTWKNYNNYLNAFRHISSEKVPRGKIKEIRNIIRDGISSTKLYVEINHLKNTFKSFPDVKSEYGFTYEDRTNLYFDAIEMIDVFIELGEEE